jgi:hypothetical protein
MLILLVCTPLWAGEIVGPDKIDPYKLIDCSVSGEWEAAIWEIEGPHAADMRPSENGMKVTWVAPPGKYTVRCVLVHFEKKKLSQEKLEVVIGTPEPEPDPNPIPPPPPVPGKRWIILIEETSERTPQLASVLTDARNVWRPYLKTQGHYFRAWDRDNVPPDGVTWLAECESVPTLFISDEEGNVSYKGPPPSTPQAMLDLIKEHGG